MNPYYKIVEKGETDKKSVYRVFIFSEHEVYKGHFPEFPILPGVMLLQMVREMSEENTGKNLQLKSAQNVKFLKMISPEIIYDVELESNLDSNDLIHVSAEIKLKDEIYFKMNAVYSC